MSRNVGATGPRGGAGRTHRNGSGQCVDPGLDWIHGPGNAGFIKLVADADRDVLVGATSVGPYGGEVLAMLVLAVHARLPVAALRTMIYAYPTFHRGVLDALADLDSGDSYQTAAGNEGTGT